MKGTTWLAACLALVLIILAGCGDTQAPNDFQKKGPTKVKLAAANSRAFQQQYGEAIQEQFPDLEIEILEYGGNLTADWLKENKPDMVYLTAETLETFEQLVQSNQLMPLEPFIQTSGFPIGDMSPGVVDKLRLMGDGLRLYGLTHSFDSIVLLYNKSLFELHEIGLPDDQLSWEEFWSLIRQFAAKDAYGLDGGSGTSLMYSLISFMGMSHGLNIVDEDGVPFGDAAWKPLLKQVVDAYAIGAIHPEITSAEDLERQGRGRSQMPQQFFGGKAAFIFFNASSIPFVESQINQNMKVDIGVAPLPVDPNNSGMGEIYINEVFAVPKVSEHPQAGWELINYLCGKTYGVKAKTNLASVYPDLVREEGRKAPDVVYSIKAVYDDEDIDLTSGVMNSLYQEIGKVVLKQQSLDEAVANLQKTE